jgi:hypothetical protein
MVKGDTAQVMSQDNGEVAPAEPVGDPVRPL